MANAATILKRADTSLALASKIKRHVLKVYDPNQPRDREGQWSDAGGGGGGGSRSPSSGSGGSSSSSSSVHAAHSLEGEPGKLFPLGLSNQQKQLHDRLSLALRTRDIMAAAGDDNTKPEMKDLHDHIQNLLSHQRKLHNNRLEALSAQNRAAASRTQDTGGRPYGSTDNFSSIQDAQRRQQEAARIQRENQARSAGYYGSASTPDTQGLGLKPLQRPERGVRQQAFDIATSAAGTTGGVTRITGRVLRSANAVHNIATGLRGAAGAADLIQVGVHLNHAKTNLDQLRAEIAALPEDAKLLRSQLRNNIRTLQQVFGAAQRVLASKLKKPKS